ncbi:STAS/SEC14 domain-containing protein [Reichenbachiella versicolor]|uniref:STAS/SEC14 domain-containing protein n=1 Tax=Reichenbachiella versicolor TaxID=1821036 RepID=UPI000D6DF608|nr:STAS/SEC14 domain-containing protein [Reichenbachiella versicolor]
MEIKLPTSAKLYIDKPYVKLYWDFKKKILTSAWTGFCTHDEILAIGQRIIDAVLIEGARKVLYDARGLEVLDASSQRYISGKFTIDMMESGVKVAAVVLPDDLFAQFTVNDIQKKLAMHGGAFVNYFEDLDKAISWLKVK